LSKKLQVNNRWDIFVKEMATSQDQFPDLPPPPTYEESQAEDLIDDASNQLLIHREPSTDGSNLTCRQVPTAIIVQSPSYNEPSAAATAFTSPRTQQHLYHKQNTDYVVLGDPNATVEELDSNTDAVLEPPGDNQQEDSDAKDGYDACAQCCWLLTFIITVLILIILGALGKLGM